MLDVLRHSADLAETFLKPTRMVLASFQRWQSLLLAAFQKIIVHGKHIWEIKDL
jgi:hypothetical protein